MPMDERRISVWPRERRSPVIIIAGEFTKAIRALTDEEWVAVAVLPADLQAVVENEFDHLQILGPLGHGKTTCLLALAARLRDAGRHAGYEYLPQRQSYFVTEPGHLHYFLLDEAHRLSNRERNRLLRLPNLHLVVGSHEDLSPLFAERRLHLTTIRIHNDASQLRAVLERRLAYFALDGRPAITFDAAAIAFLHQLLGGKLRAAEDFLYEVFQRLPPPGVITAGQLEAVSYASKTHPST